jgi:hypothetical protein
MASETAARERGAGLAHERLQLREELLDRIEVRRVFWKEEEARASGFDGGADRLSLVRPEIVENDDVVTLEGENKELLDIGEEALAIDGSVEQAGRFDRSLRSAARKVAVFQWPCGTLSMRRRPFGANRGGGSCSSWSRSRQ